MARLEGIGHEERLANARRGFRKAGADIRRPDLWAYVQTLRDAFGILVLGAMIGVSGFVVVDSLREPEHQTREGMFAFRGPYYASCREVFLDGRANIRRGEPGYRPALDADGDGLACEPYAPRS
jgi:hypothetical protein